MIPEGDNHRRFVATIRPTTATPFSLLPTVSDFAALGLQVKMLGLVANLVWKMSGLVVHRRTSCASSRIFCCKPFVGEMDEARLPFQ